MEIDSHKIGTTTTTAGGLLFICMWKLKGFVKQEKLFRLA